MICYFDLLTVL